ncbi:MAG TPA: zinc ribbon domain-containing protein [Verrucomicrobiae bacterium]|jgi:putative FmdB family regulatory protein
MPTYEYVCSKCEHQFEKFQRMTEKALTVCPKESCPRKPWGKGKVKRAVSAGAGLIFKGSGFYITDYRSEGYKAAQKKESAGGSASSSDTGKKETKSTNGKGEKASGSSPPASKSSKPD